MKKLALLVILACPSPLFGVFSVIQTATNYCDDAAKPCGSVGDPLIITFGANYTAGHALIVFVSGRTSPSAVNDGASDIFEHKINYNPSGLVMDVYHVCSTAGGSNTVTLTLAGVQFTDAIAVEASGFASSSCDDRTGQASDTGATSLTVSTSGAVQRSSELVFAHFNAFYPGAPAGLTITPDTGWTAERTVDLTGPSVDWKDYDQTQTKDARSGLSGVQSATSGYSASSNPAAVMITFCGPPGPCSSPGGAVRHKTVIK